MKTTQPMIKKTFAKISLYFILMIITGIIVLQQGCMEQSSLHQLQKQTLNQSTSIEKGSEGLFAPFLPHADQHVLHPATEEEILHILMARENQLIAVRTLGGERIMTTETSAKMSQVAEMDTTPADYSQTNNYVQGIDEADIMKTDGIYLYTITGKTIFILKAYPGEDAKILSTIVFDQQPQALFIKDNKLIVMGSVLHYEILKKQGITPGKTMSFVSIYDIENKTHPIKITEHYLEGSYYDGRMQKKKNEIILFTQSWPQPIIRDPLPKIIVDGQPQSVRLHDIIYFPYPYQRPSYFLITKINLNEPKHLQTKTIIVEGNVKVYVNEKNIYLAETKYISEWQLRNKIMIEKLIPQLPQKEKSLINQIKAIDDAILSPAEKEQKILQIINWWMQYELNEDEQKHYQEQIEKELDEILKKYQWQAYTIIHKINNDDLTIKASTEVPGTIINQFSMKETDGIFSLATTLNPLWRYTWKEETQRPEAANGVFTYDKELHLLDSITNIAPNERIYSTRFIGKRLYLVTFRQRDPFFVLDLSNPKKIKILGKLKIPGFSRYLHPYDNSTIIGIGRETDERGRTQGLKIGLYDVTNPEHPKELAKFVTKEKYASSIAEYEHKAFLFSREKHLLVIPAYSSSWKNGNYLEDYNGAMVFFINKTTITLKGIIDHSNNEQYYGTRVQRSLYIGNYLYTKSPSLLRINKLPSLAAVKDIPLQEEKEVPYPTY